MKVNRSRVLQMKPTQQQEVQHEIKIFLKALASYPESFACNPCLSFERHLGTLAAENSSVQYQQAR